MSQPAPARRMTVQTNDLAIAVISFARLKLPTVVAEEVLEADITMPIVMATKNSQTNDQCSLYTFVSHQVGK